MGRLVILQEKPVKAKGLNIKAYPDEDKLKEFLFDEEYQNLKRLEDVPPFTWETETPLLFYPGSGSDILFPLLFLEKLFPRLKEARFLFIDVNDDRGLIKTLLDEVGVSFSEKKNGLDFYWKKKLIHLEFRVGDVFQNVPEQFDLYFERAFRIMKDSYPGYEKEVFEKLRKGGVIVSDSGFLDFPLERIPIAKGLSAYGEMVVGVKDGRERR